MTVDVPTPARRTVTIPVFAFGADPKAVAQAVRDHGFVVLETTRTEAKRILAEVRSLLGIDPESEEPPYLHHGALPVSDRGWVDHFIHSDVFDDVYSHRQPLLAAAMRVWLAAGQPDYCVARVAFPAARP